MTKQFNPITRKADRKQNNAEAQAQAEKARQEALLLAAAQRVGLDIPGIKSSTFSASFMDTETQVRLLEAYAVVLAKEAAEFAARWGKAGYRGLSYLESTRIFALEELAKLRISLAKEAVEPHDRGGRR